MPEKIGTSITLKYASLEGRLIEGDFEACIATIRRYLDTDTSCLHKRIDLDCPHLWTVFVFKTQAYLVARHLETGFDKMPNWHKIRSV